MTSPMSAGVSRVAGAWPFLPALLWWTADVAVYWIGRAEGASGLYATWRTGLELLPGSVQRTIAYSGVPSITLALLATGALITVNGRRAIPAVAGWVAGAMLVGSVAALLGVRFLEVVIR